MSVEKMREALELAEAALSGANMNKNVVMRKVREALDQREKQEPVALLPTSLLGQLRQN